MLGGGNRLQGLWNTKEWEEGNTRPLKGLQENHGCCIFSCATAEPKQVKGNVPRCFLKIEKIWL